MITGSMALALYVTPRMTRDIDYLKQWARELQVEKLLTRVMDSA
jgi:hypothetical protein